MTEPTTAEQVFCEHDAFGVMTKAGEPYRLFPFGTLVKGGVKHVITPEMARKFRLPHFKPPIKLGSHDERTPAGGHIVGLEVREDGLYAVPEFTEQGETSLGKGDYRYHSPEVIWEGGGLEDPTNGNIIEGPFIVGDALLHTPHLGESAALYSFEINPMKEVTNMAETIEVPKGLWDRFTAWLDKKTAEPEPEPAPVTPELPAATPPVIELDKFEAMQKERDELTAKLQAIETEKAKAARVEKFAASLKEARVEQGAEMLAGMSDEQAEWVLQQFKAMSAKVDTSALYGEIGSNGEGTTASPSAALDAAIRARMDEKKINYTAAMLMVQAEQPDLFAAAYPTKRG